jgi:peptidoglycan/LPS O-acetylase OafA/YrhL
VSESHSALDHEPALPPPENKVFYPALDGLRAVAMLLVFTFHYFALPRWLNWGWVGVDLFFVLSGFLITGILYDTRLRPHRFRTFYIRRALRIFPLYYLVLFAGLALWPIYHWRTHPALWLWPAYLGNYARFLWSAAYAPNATIYEVLTPTTHVAPNAYYILDHLWSLCVEEQFYLVWPLIVFLIKDRIRLRNLCIAVAVMLPLLRLLCLHTIPAALINSEFLYRITPLRADSLLLGGALALALRGPEATRIYALARPCLLALLALFAIIEAISTAIHGHLVDSAWTMSHSAFAFSFIALISATIILLTIEPRTALYNALMHPSLRALGQRSYGFYVYHQLLYSAFSIIALHLSFGHKRFMLEQRAIVAFLFTGALAWLSYRYFEQPFLRLKQRLAP